MKFRPKACRICPFISIWNSMRSMSTLRVLLRRESSNSRRWKSIESYYKILLKNSSLKWAKNSWSYGKFSWNWLVLILLTSLESNSMKNLAWNWRSAYNIEWYKKTENQPPKFTKRLKLLSKIVQQLQSAA